MTKTIMVVDDEESMLELIRTLLEEDGYNVVVALSGAECIEKLKKTKPDLIVMDMMMPGMSGREVTKLIRKNPDTKDIKIIFLTVARFSDIGMGMLEDLHVSEYISKPFENNDFREKIKKIIM